MRAMFLMMVWSCTTLADDDETEGRSSAVKTVHGLPHDEPKDSEEATKTSYHESTAKFGILVGAAGLILLGCHGCFRIWLCTRSCCCAMEPLRCIEKHKGKNRRWQGGLLLWIILIAGLLFGFAYPAREKLFGALDDVSDGLDQLIELLEDLQANVKSMLSSTATITTAFHDLTCPGGLNSSTYLDQISDVNETMGTLDEEFDDALGPLENFEDKVQSQGKKYVRQYFPMLIGGPFILTLTFGFCGSLLGGCCGGLAKMDLNVMSIWAGLIGLPAALVVFVALFTSSFLFSDVCYIGPASVLLAKNDNNKYISYYLKCEGDNPFRYDVGNATEAVSELSEYTDLLATVGCGPSATLTTLDAAVANLETNAQDIANTTLSCTLFEPIIQSIVYDALCDKTVAGLLSACLALASSGLATLVLLFYVPCFRMAFSRTASTAKVGTIEYDLDPSETDAPDKKNSRGGSQQQLLKPVP